MNIYIPIDTELGILSGRDCIYLDKVDLTNGTNTLKLSGEINGNLCSQKRSGLFIPYQFTFSGVLALKMIELDSWDFLSESSFDEIKKSTWLKKLDGKVNPSEHKHYIIQTYDEVFEVICNKFKFEINE